MRGSVYDKLKKQKGETFARTLRDYHNGLLEIPDIEAIVCHAGRDAPALLPYLMSLLAANDDSPPAAPGDPFLLLAQAGYEAFHADSLQKQNSIRHYFAPDELLCTFNDAARYQNYHIVHAVKKNVDALKRPDFKGKEARQDAYGTSVISIQMLKQGGFISIKNRYNHSVTGCDNTFNSNPDNIIDGLSAALKTHFNVEFSATKYALPEGYAVIGAQVFKYHEERDNIYYGDQSWGHNGQIHIVDRGRGDALFDGFLFDNQTRTLQKIDPEYDDSFADDFNRDYGGNHGLCVDKHGNLTLEGHILIGAEQSQIKTLNLPALTAMGDRCLCNADALTHFAAPALTTMGTYCLYNAAALTHFAAPALTAMGDCCLCDVKALTHFAAPALAIMGDRCLYKATALTHFAAPALATVGNECLYCAPPGLKRPAPTNMGGACISAVKKLHVS